MFTCNLFPSKVALPIVFSVPLASLALMISPAKVSVALCAFRPSVSYTRTTYSSVSSAFFSALINTLRLSETTNENDFPAFPLCFSVRKAFSCWFSFSAFSTVAGLSKAP